MISVYLSDLPQVPVKQKYRTEHQKGLELLSYGLKEMYQLDFSAEQLPNQIEKGEYGKTYLREHPKIHFNISHCEGMAVCAFADTEIGVDAEKKDEVNEKIFRRVFTSSEQELLKSRKENEEEYRESFYRLWTLKESRIKQNGSGMSMPLTDFSFTFEEWNTFSEKREKNETTVLVFENLRKEGSTQEKINSDRTECVSLSEVQCTEPDLQFKQYRIAGDWIIAICVEQKCDTQLIKIRYL